MRGTCNYAPCRGFDIAGYVQSVDELARACRGHPSIFAYSVENESGEEEEGRPLIAALIDAAAAADGSVPLTTEGSGGAPGYNGSAAASAVNLLHYALPDDSRSHIRAVGECAWCVEAGLEDFSGLALAGRRDDVAYYAGWDMLNFWSNLFPGYSAARHAWRQPGCAGRDRTDGVDGWGSPLVDWVQRGFGSFLPLDLAALAASPRFAGPGWPYAAAAARVAAGGAVRRTYAVFNDVLRGDLQPWAEGAAARELSWSAHWDTPSGPAVAQGAANYTIAPGFHAIAPVEFFAPAPGAAERKLFIVARNAPAGGGAGGGELVGVEDRVWVTVTPN